ncbi:unnamed protein product [Schistosoma curassoni]|uniref:RWD domain-containing protein n=1 Tax=Schistosoma curassoni TaxID=6186 RepID=A0A183KDE1_9TREM|nr:unnamed protein product [Schistosoma curassoni]
MVEGSLLGTRRQGVPVILREMVLPDCFDPLSPSFTVRDVTTELSRPRPTSCRTEIKPLKSVRYQDIIQSLIDVIRKNKPVLYLLKEWISIETLDNIRERKNKTTAINNSLTKTKKLKAQVKYTEANKQVKRRIRADSQNYEEDLATTADKAAKEGNLKQSYDNEETCREL